MEMDVSQYKDLFITEALEHLDALNRSLLELEKDPGNTAVVAEIFRSAHTLKGMSATMGYDQLTELAHEMENLLEHLRSGDMQVTDRVVDILFSCFDTLGSIVEAIQADSPDRVDYSSLVSRIGDAIESVEEQAGVVEEHRVPEPEPEAQVEQPATTAEEPGAEAGPPGEVAGAAGRAGEMTRDVAAEAVPVEPAAREEPSPAPAVDLEVKETDFRKYTAIPGMRLLRLIVELDADCLLKSVRVFMVFKKMAQLGEVLGASPPVEALEDEKFDRSFQVAVATQRVPEALREALLGIAEVAAVTAEALYEPPPQERGAVASQAVGPGAEGDALALARRTQSVRVNIGRLDTLMNLVGELVINRTRLSEIASTFDLPELREALDQTTRLTADLQDEVMKTRMVPVEHVFNRFPRMVRDLARQQGKEIELVVEGKEIELDRTILDEISDPLIHMIRNAVDHGIARPKARLEQGKEITGTIRLSAYRDRNYVAIEVEDDGEGISRDQVFDSALQNGLITPEERAQLTDEDILRVISMPGFSTSAKVDGVSGRGVGMDAVKYKAESLGGFVMLDTAPGRGTRLTLKLPLTLAIIQALMVEVGGEAYAIPLGIVRETQVVEPDDVRTVQNQETIFLRDETVPLLRLDRMLESTATGNGAEPFPAVIAEVGPSLIAIAVHSLIGQREIVINTLDRFLKRIDGFAGATILGTGRVALILDIPSLVAGQRAARATGPIWKHA